MVFWGLWPTDGKTAGMVAKAGLLSLPKAQANIERSRNTSTEHSCAMTAAGSVDRPYFQGRSVSAGAAVLQHPVRRRGVGMNGDDPSDESESEVVIIFCGGNAGPDDLHLVLSSA
jgi:hypothetical protein